MTAGPRYLWEFPWIVVAVDCKLCPRRGRYRLVRLAARFGPEIELERLLDEIAFDCPYMHQGVKPRKYEARCGIRFTDLNRTTPPPDLPPAAPSERLRVVGGRDVERG